MDDQKSILRREALRHRSLGHFRSEEPSDVVPLFFEHIQPGSSDIIALYWPKDGEFDVSPLMEALFERDHKLALPVIQKGSRELLFASWVEENTLEKGPFGVFQPIIGKNTAFFEPDIIIVPFLAFDRQGHRLGYGGGYYDTTLAALRAQKKICAVGMGYAGQAVLFNLPADDHDQKLDWVITPLEARCFA